MLAGLIGWLVAGRILAPVREVRLAAEQIGESDLTRRIDVRGSDDVAALGRTFNTMLDRLERAFADQREFIDDAGHELRTPITIVRGHLELMRDDPDDLAVTRRLVQDELGRMQRMVDDLLVLAKSGRPDFLRPEAVDLADLTVETLAKARSLADRTWRLDEVAETAVRADGQRLVQALLQLVANAVRHTTTGQEIAVGSAVTATSVCLWVRDTGEGVPPDSRARIFERFKRGSNAAGDDGAGLGLPIVAAIAGAHGGAVLLDSGVPRPPAGPAAPVQDPDPHLRRHGRHLLRAEAQRTPRRDGQAAPPAPDRGGGRPDAGGAGLPGPGTGLGRAPACPAGWVRCSSPSTGGARW